MSEMMWKFCNPGDYFLNLEKHVITNAMNPVNMGGDSAHQKAVADEARPQAPFAKDLYRFMFQNQGNKLGHVENVTSYQWLGETANYSLEILKFLAPRDRVLFSGFKKEAQDDGKFTHETLASGAGGYGNDVAYTDSHHGHHGTAADPWIGQGIGTWYENVNFLGSIKDWNNVFTTNHNKQNRDKTVWDSSTMLYNNTYKKDPLLATTETNNAVGKIRNISVADVFTPFNLLKTSTKPAAGGGYTGNDMTITALNQTNYFESGQTKHWEGKWVGKVSWFDRYDHKGNVINKEPSKVVSTNGGTLTIDRAGTYQFVASPPPAGSNLGNGATSSGGWSGSWGGAVVWAPDTIVPTWVPGPDIPGPNIPGPDVPGPIDPITGLPTPPLVPGPDIPGPNIPGPGILVDVAVPQASQSTSSGGYSSTVNRDGTYSTSVSPPGSYTGDNVPALTNDVDVFITPERDNWWGYNTWRDQYDEKGTRTWKELTKNVALPGGGTKIERESLKYTYTCGLGNLEAALKYDPRFLAITEEATKMRPDWWTSTQTVLNQYAPVENGGSFAGAGGWNYVYTGSWRDIAVNKVYNMVAGSGGVEHKLAVMTGLIESRRRYDIAMSRLYGDNGVDSGAPVHWWSDADKAPTGDWFNMMIFQIATGQIHGLTNNLSGIFYGDHNGSLGGAWGNDGINMRNWLLSVTQADVENLANTKYGGSFEAKQMLLGIWGEFGAAGSVPKALPSNYQHGQTDWEKYTGAEKYASVGWYETENQFNGFEKSLGAGVSTWDAATKFIDSDNLGAPISNNWAVHNFARVMGSPLKVFITLFGEQMLNDICFNRPYNAKWTEYRENVQKKEDNFREEDTALAKKEQERIGLNKQAEQLQIKKAQEFQAELKALAQRRANERKQESGS